MINFSLTYSRRSFLKVGTTSLISLFSVLNVGCDVFKKEKLTLEQKLIQSLDHLERAQEIGNAYRSQNHTLKSYSVEHMTNALLNWIKLDVAEAQKLSDKELTHLLGQQIRDDFLNEDVVIIGQWMFSKTDVMLCALADIYHQSKLS